MAGKKFRFSLQSVLTLRSYEADQAQQVLGQAATDRQDQEGQVAEAQAALLRLPDSVTLNGSVKPMALRRHEAQRHAALLRHDKAQRRLNNLREREAKARAALRERHQAEEALKTLRQRKHAEHQYEQERSEAAFLDELAGFRRGGQMRTPASPFSKATG